MPRVPHMALLLALALPSLPPPASARPRGRIDPAVVREARRMSARIQASVSALRGLPVRRKLVVGVYDKARLVEFVRGQLLSGAGGRRLARQSRSWRALGLLPPGYDLAEGLSSLLGEQVAGLYDPKSRKLRIMARLVPVGPQVASPLELLTGSRRDQARFVLAHEIVHALQDQHHGLRRMSRDRPGWTDLEIALSGLFEGDATAAGLAWMLADRGAFDERAFFQSGGMMGWLMGLALRLARLGLLPDTASLRATPRVLQDRLLFPYSDGLGFAMKVGERGGFAAIDALYRAPPLSTEQILHPGKLLDSPRDQPTLLRLPGLARTLGGGRRRVDADTLGELLIRALLHGVAPAASPEAAAAGWGGDRYVLYARKRGGDALVWLSTWDSEADAVEFERALRLKVGPRLGRTAFVGRRGPDVLLMTGEGEAAWTRVAPRVFSRTTRRKLTRLPRR